MPEKEIKLTDYYDEFDVIDLDAQGGYARAAEVRSLAEDGLPLRAFKVMRLKPFEGSASSDFRATTFERFVAEFKLMQQIQARADAPSVFIRLYDSGFVGKDVLKTVFEDYARNPYDVPAYRTGLDRMAFEAQWRELERKTPGRFQPFLVLEQTAFDDSLFCTMNRRQQWNYGDLLGGTRQFVSRLPLGEALYLTLQLAHAADWLHRQCGVLYWDWKPEHIYWGLANPPGQTPVNWQPKLNLIDFNVTRPFNPDAPQDMQVEVRNLCGACLYPALVLRDLEGRDIRFVPGKTSHPSGIVQTRYAQREVSFHHAEQYLDEPLKAIIRRALHPEQGYDTLDAFREDLRQYGLKTLGLDFSLSDPTASPQVRSAGKQYWQGVQQLRLGQYYLQNARQQLLESYANEGIQPDESLNLLNALDYTFKHFLLP